MKKKLIVLAITIIILLTTVLVGCNKQLIDTKFSFKYAVIAVGDGTVIKGEVSSWLDFENSDQIQVTIDGVTYLVHSSNATLMSKAP